METHSFIGRSGVARNRFRAEQDKYYRFARTAQSALIAAGDDGSTVKERETGARPLQPIDFNHSQLISGN